MKTKSRKSITTFERIVERKERRLPREKLDQLLDEVTWNVKPSEIMIKLYNAVGRLPFPLGTLLITLTSIDTLQVVYHAWKRSTDAALRVMYNSQFRIHRGPWALGDSLWRNSYNVRSVRARGQFVRKAVKLLLKELEKEKISEDYKIASLGSGSATQFLKGVNSNHTNHKSLHISLVDLDSSALQRAQEGSPNSGIKIEFMLQTIGQFLSHKEDSSLHLIEMVGLADYLKEHQLRRYLRKIFKSLIPGGFFLGANISSKEEKYFAHGAARWPSMYYRSEKELQGLIEKADFRKIWTGKCGLYTIWVAQKTR